MAKGKYADVIGDLPKSFGTEPDYQDKVNAMKRTILESVLPPDKVPLSTEAIEDLLGDITAMQKVLNDEMMLQLNGRKQAAHLARVYRDLRMIKKNFEQQEKITNILIEAYEQIMVDQYEAEGMKSIALNDGGSVWVGREPHAVVTDREANRKWAVKEGLENLLTIPWQTVNALAKKALLDGSAEPDGVDLESWPVVKYIAER